VTGPNLSTMPPDRHSRNVDEERLSSLEDYIGRFLAYRSHTYGRHAGQHYPSDERRTCAVCFREYTRPSRMGPAPLTCSKRCAATRSKRIARHGADSPLVNRDLCHRRASTAASGLSPTPAPTRATARTLIVWQRTAIGVGCVLTGKCPGTA
jgi:hypothetical protein